MMWLRRAMGLDDMERPAPSPVSPIENNPVGWSSIYPPPPGQVIENASPEFSPLASSGTMTSEQKLGRFWNAATGRAKQAYTNADLPQLAAAGNEAYDAAMGWAGATTPIRAYHGSPHTFDKFDLSKAGTTTDAGELGRALYFTTDGKTVMSPPFAGPGTKWPNRYEVNLAVKNPFELELPSWSADKAKLIRQKLDLPPDATAKQVAEKVQSMGHDATMLDYSPMGYQAKEIAVYDPDIIDILKRYGLFGLGMVGGAAAGPYGADNP